jgi:quinol monooxygenase YgiN
MIVVSGTITYEPAHHDGVRAAVLRVAEATRAEDGCITYEFFADLAGPGRMRVFEEWETDEALKTHATQPHMVAFREELSNFTMTSREITRYVVGETSQL